MKHQLPLNDIVLGFESFGVFNNLLTFLFINKISYVIASPFRNLPTNPL